MDPVNAMYRTLLHEVGHAVVIRQLSGPVIIELFVDSYADGSSGGGVKYRNPWGEGEPTRQQLWNSAVIAVAGFVAMMLYDDQSTTTEPSRRDRAIFDAVMDRLAIPPRLRPLHLARAFLAAEGILVKTEAEYRTTLDFVLGNNHQLPPEYLWSDPERTDA